MRLPSQFAALALALLLLPQASQAATARRASAAPAGRTQDITVNPLGLAFGLGNVSYEHSLGIGNSWLIGGDFASYGPSTSKLNIFGVMGAYRWFFDQEKALNGWYAGPEAKVESISWNYSVSNSNYNAGGVFFGVGGQGGYQWIFRNGFTLNLGLDLGYLAGSISSNVTGAPALGFGGTYVGGNLGLGYAF